MCGPPPRLTPQRSPHSGNAARAASAQHPLTTVSTRLLCHTKAYPACLRFVSLLASGGPRPVTEPLVNIVPCATRRPHALLCHAAPCGTERPAIRLRNRGTHSGCEILTGCQKSAQKSPVARGARRAPARGLGPSLGPCAELARIDREVYTACQRPLTRSHLVQIYSI